MASTSSFALLDSHNKDIGIDQKEPIVLTVTSMIMELGVPANIKGYLYLREAIIYKADDLNPSISLTKELYPFIAKQFNTTSMQVERSIRYAIEVAWNRGNGAARQKFFGSTISRMPWNPSNGEFIATLVDYVKIRAHAQ